MNRLLVAAVCAAMAVPTIAVAHDHEGHPYAYGHPGWGPPPHAGWYVPPPRPVYPVYYGAYRDHGYGYAYYPRHKHHDDDDDALWAIGGVVAGVIIGSVIDNSYVAPPPPPHR